MTDRDILRSYGYDPDDPVPRDNQGEPVIRDELLSKLATVDAPHGIPHQAAWAIQPELTATEIDVLRCYSYGMDRQMTADTLGRSFETVKEQLRGVRYKLRAKNSTHACCEAIRRGLIP